MSPYPLSFFLAVLSSFLVFFSFQLLFTPLPIYVERIGGQTSQVGLAMGALALAAVSSRPLVGWLVDRWGSRKLLIIGSFVFTLSPLFYNFSRTLPSFVASRLFHGFGLGAFTTAYIVLIADLAPEERRGEAIGLSSLGSSVSVMLAPPLGEVLMGRMGFAPLFLGAALMAFSSLVIALPIAEPKTTGDGSSFRQLAGDRRVLVPSIATWATALTYSAILAFLPLFARGQGIANPALFFTAHGLTYTGAPFLAGRLSDRVGRRQVIVPAMSVLALAFFLFPFVHALHSLLAVAVLYGLSFGSARAALSAIIVDRVPTSLRGTAMGIAYASFDLGMGSSFFLGFIVEALGYGAMFGLVGAICLMGAGLLF